jgi:hypothetical protein
MEEILFIYNYGQLIHLLVEDNKQLESQRTKGEMHTPYTMHPLGQFLACYRFIVRQD